MENRENDTEFHKTGQQKYPKQIINTSTKHDPAGAGVLITITVVL